MGWRCCCQSTTRSGTTRCKGLAGIVMRGGEPVGREPLIRGVPARLCRLRLEQCAGAICSRAISSVSSKELKVFEGGPKRLGLIKASSNGLGSKDLMQCPAAGGVEALCFQRWPDSTLKRPVVVLARSAGGLEWPAGSKYW